MCLYVDEILLLGTNINVVKEVKDDFSQNFEMKSRRHNLKTTTNLELLKGVYNNEQPVAKSYSDGPLLLLTKASPHCFAGAAVLHAAFLLWCHVWVLQPALLWPRHVPSVLTHDLSGSKHPRIRVALGLEFGVEKNRRMQMRGNIRC